MRSTPLIIPCLALGLFACRSEAPSADAPHGSAEGHTAVAAAAPRTTLLPALRPYHRVIRTKSPEAQQFFDEGLTLLYGFNHEEASRSFARAAALDSLSPMPYWGMALALGTNINDPAPVSRMQRAHGYVMEAARRLSQGSAEEQGLVAALRLRYSADSTGDQGARERAYSDAMGSLAKQFPDDPDVGALHAESLMNQHPWRLYTPDGTPESWTPAIVAELERVLAGHPEHPGANHFYIHAVEASKAPARARASARRLETLVPGAGHLIHMPSHIYIRTGDFEQSARSNATAAAVDESYFGSQGTESFYAMSYYSHNLQFQSASAMFGGNLADGRQSARRVARLVASSADQMAMLEPFAAQELFVLVRFGQWAEILNRELTAPPATRTLQTGFFHWARGAALAATGKSAEAVVELQALQRTTVRVPKDAMVGPVNWGGDVLAVAVADLEGRIAEGRGARPAAIAAYRRAVEAEDRLGYNEPPDWLLPERERLGVLLLADGRAPEAEAVFREDLARHVGNPRALFGLWKSLAAQRRETSAVQAQFEAAWHWADVTLGDDLYPTAVPKATTAH